MADNSSPTVRPASMKVTGPDAAVATVPMASSGFLKRAVSHRLAGVVGKLAVSALLIWLVCRNIDPSGIARRFVGQAPEWLIAAGLSTLVQLPLAALRWQRILRVLGIQIPGRTVLAVSFIGSFCNSWLLGTGSGDVARAMIAPPDARGRGAVIHSVLFDRLATFGGIAMTILPVIALNLGPLARGLPVLISLAIVLAPFVGLFWLEPITTLIVRWRLPLAWVVAGLVESWQRLRRAWRPVSLALVLAVMSEIALTLTAYCLARAQHLDVSFADFLMLVPPVLLLGALPISIGGWGVRENVLVLGLAPIGVAPASALLIGLQIGLLASLVSLPGGPIWLFGHVARRP
jgi:glycosyltransferase 2 family protein